MHLLFFIVLGRSVHRYSNASLEILPAAKFHTLRLCCTCVPRWGCLLRRRSVHRQSSAPLEILPAAKFHTLRLCCTCVPSWGCLLRHRLVHSLFFKRWPAAFCPVLPRALWCGLPHQRGSYPDGGLRRFPWQLWLRPWPQRGLPWGQRGW